MNQGSFKIDTPSPTEAVKNVEAYWALMAPSFEYGGMEYSAKELAKDLTSGDVLLIRVWMGKDTVVSISAVQVREHYGTRDLFIMATGSTADINEWIDDFDKVLVELATEVNCQTITVSTREGMGRISRRRGYKVHQVVIRKRVGKSNGR